MIPVTKPYLPCQEKLKKYIDGIYERQWLTNGGPLAQELTRRLEEYLGVENLLLVSNGTLALQVAYRALGISDTDRENKPEAITTPFTFIATASSLKWEGIQPVFADINPRGWCLEPSNIDAVVTPHTRAIVPVHVFGNACEVEVISDVAKRHGLKVIYDAAHAFGVKYKGESLLKYGDAATLSFHATKLFHTIEGGAVVFKHKEDLERARKIVNFGISGPSAIDELGINAKMNEFQAAMGLCVLDDIESIQSVRAEVVETYDSHLAGCVQKQLIQPDTTHNYAYYPVALRSSREVDAIMSSLSSVGVNARRYFYPSLETVSSLGATAAACEESNKLAERIICLPLYAGLSRDDIALISGKVKEGC